MNIVMVEEGSALWELLADYAQHCSWEAGPHLAGMLHGRAFTDWEAVFAALDGRKIVGFCTFLKKDYYPENRYSPWISSIFVDESCRGQRLSGELIEAAIAYARSKGFSRVYIPSNIKGLYEKYGFERIDELVNYAGDVDQIFAKSI